MKTDLLKTTVFVETSDEEEDTREQVKVDRSSRIRHELSRCTLLTAMRIYIYHLQSRCNDKFNTWSIVTILSYFSFRETNSFKNPFRCTVVDKLVNYRYLILLLKTRLIVLCISSTSKTVLLTYLLE